MAAQVYAMTFLVLDVIGSTSVGEEAQHVKPKQNGQKCFVAISSLMLLGILFDASNLVGVFTFDTKFPAEECKTSRS